jgi:hypothetical protein
MTDAAPGLDTSAVNDSGASELNSSLLDDIMGADLFEATLARQHLTPAPPGVDDDDAEGPLDLGGDRDDSRSYNDDGGSTGVVGEYFLLDNSVEAGADGGVEAGSAFGTGAVAVVGGDGWPTTAGPVTAVGVGTSTTAASGGGGAEAAAVATAAAGPRWVPPTHIASEKELQQLLQRVTGSKHLPPVPRPVEPSHAPGSPVPARLHAIQRFICSFEYNYSGVPFVTLRKDRGFLNVITSAKEIIAKALPIQCIEAVFLGGYLTLDMREVRRGGGGGHSRARFSASIPGPRAVRVGICASHARRAVWAPAPPHCDLHHASTGHVWQGKPRAPPTGSVHCRTHALESSWAHPRVLLLDLLYFGGCVCEPCGALLSAVVLLFCLVSCLPSVR